MKVTDLSIQPNIEREPVVKRFFEEIGIDSGTHALRLGGITDDLRGLDTCSGVRMRMHVIPMGQGRRKHSSGTVSK